MGFDESQHLRDDHGRFSSSGVAEFVNKHATHSYSNVGPAKGVGEWVGKVSDRTRDVEIPLIRKTEEHVATTGEISLADLHAPLPIAGQDRYRLAIRTRVADFFSKTRIGDQEASTRAGYAETKNMLEQEKLNKKTQKLSNQIKQVRDDIASIKSMGVENHAKELAEKEKQHTSLMKKMDKLNGKGGQLGKLLDEGGKIDVEHQDATERLTASSTAENFVERLKNELRANRSFVGEPSTRADHSNADATVNISHSKDGSYEIHLKGNSHDEKYPGEKEMTVMIEPATHKLDKDGTMAEVDRHSTITVTSQYPTDSRGKDHPATKEDVIKTGSSLVQFQPMLIRHGTFDEHIKNFLTS